MVDTLRYFFSSVFQGYAAITTLGIMFYLYYLDKVRKSLEDIESSFSGYKPSSGTEEDFYVKEHGLTLFVKNKVLPLKVNIPAYDYVRQLVALYEEKIEHKDSFNRKLLRLFKIAVLILLVFLISLFCIGYYEWLNNILFFSGILDILLSFVFFVMLYSFIKDIINRP
jgi:hypothetical protein